MNAVGKDGQLVQLVGAAFINPAALPERINIRIVVLRGTPCYASKE
jgi:hypothetical protein